MYKTSCHPGTSASQVFPEFLFNLDEGTSDKFDPCKSTIMSEVAPMHHHYKLVCKLYLKRVNSCLVLQVVLMLET